LPDRRLRRFSKRARASASGVNKTLDADHLKETSLMATVPVPEVDNGLAAEDRKGLVGQLAGVLDAVYSLMIRTHVYHWNVEGVLFEPVHKLTEAHYSALFASVDEIAERMRALDGKPAVNVNGFPTGVANLRENLSAEAMLADLARSHDAVARQMRKVVSAATEYEDVVTADLLTGMMAQLEKGAWMLRAMLKK
jgi:starvation-inducible DNA-binding protein